MCVKLQVVRVSTWLYTSTVDDGYGYMRSVIWGGCLTDLFCFVLFWQRKAAVSEVRVGSGIVICTPDYVAKY